ncbi:MAG: hypothetical protein Kow0060_20180 [Methylohalobius crimeensis]
MNTVSVRSVTTLQQGLQIPEEEAVEALSCPGDPHVLDAGEVQLIAVEVKRFFPLTEKLAAILSEDELARAARFRFQNGRLNYITARGLLRHLLAAYLDTVPEAIRFAYNTYGKPVLKNGARPLQFNLSHAGAWVLYSFSRDRRVGVDLEPIRQEFPCEYLDPNVFSEREQSEFDRLSSGEKHRAFIRGWTRKEALLKGDGRGLSVPLHRVEVPLGDLMHPAPVTIRGDRVGTRWWLYSLELLPEGIGALAVEGGPVRVSIDRGAWLAEWIEHGALHAVA